MMLKWDKLRIWQHSFGIHCRANLLPICPKADFPYSPKKLQEIYAQKEMFNYAMTSIKMKISKKWETLTGSSKLNANITYKECVRQYILKNEPIETVGLTLRLWLSSYEDGDGKSLLSLVLDHKTMHKFNWKSIHRVDYTRKSLTPFT